MRAVLTALFLTFFGLGMATSGASSAHAAVLSVGLGPAGSASGPPYGGYVCADVPGNSFAAGVSVQAFQCHGGSNQDWELIGLGIYGMSGSRCLDVRGGGTGAGTQVDSYVCTGGANQQWYYYNGQIVGLQSGLCLDAGNMANLTLLVINYCNGSPSQQWQFK